MRWIDKDLESLSIFLFVYCFDLSSEALKIVISGGEQLGMHWDLGDYESTLVLDFSLDVE